MKLTFLTVLASFVFVAPVTGWQATKSGTTPASQTAVTKDGRTVILKNNGTWEYAAKAPQPADAPVIAVQKPTQQPSITLDEKIKLWKGQKVVVLPSAEPNTQYFAPRYPAAHVRLRRYSESEKFQVTTKQQNFEFFKTYDSLGLPSKEYTGRTGVVLDIAKRDLVDYSLVLEYLVALDGSGEKIVLRTADPDDPDLGFLAEMELAKTYVGRSVWNQGSWKGVAKHTQKITVSRAEWRTVADKQSAAIALWFKSDTGQEGPRDCVFDNRFRVKETKGCFSDDYLEDPRAKYPKWPRQIWQLIEDQQVAVGMTEDMASLACAPWMEKAGFILAGDTMDIIYRGCGKKFVVAGGKVTKYVE